jgi:hypothetical protein
VIKEKASGAGRCCHPPQACVPRRVALPTPSEPVRAPARKSGGAFLPTARQAGPSHRDRRRCLGNRIPSDREPRPAKGPSVLDRPPGRNTHLARRRGPASPRPFTARGCDTSAMPRPPWTGRQVLVRTTWPSTSMTEASAAEPHRPKPSTPDDPALGRTTAAREHASPRLIPARQDRPGTRPDASAY